MNPLNASPTYVTSRPDLSITEHRAPIAMPRSDSFFQGWGPKL
ncbi:MAG TPA: hypothetical protein VIN40_02895 [Candidatus Tyrphobacter sp.]